MKIDIIGKKIIFIDGTDRYTTLNKSRANEVFNLWLHGERLPKPRLK